MDDMWEYILDRDEKINAELASCGNYMFKDRLTAAIEYRKKQDEDFSQNALAEAMNIKPQKICGYKKGSKGNDNPSEYRIRQFANALGVRYEYLACQGGYMTEQEMIEEYESMKLYGSSETGLTSSEEQNNAIKMYVWIIVETLHRNHLSLSGFDDATIERTIQNYDYSKYNEAVYDIVSFIRYRIRRETFDNKNPGRKDFWKYGML